jgi:hypothetical protein
MAGDCLRIANASGFFGDRFSAPREMIEGGPIDVLTGDYLAELTLAILHKTRASGARAGYAHSFLRQLEELLGTCLQRGIKVVTNAGGLNPRALADALRSLAERLGVPARIAHIEGDDLLARLPELRAQGHALAHFDTGAPFDSLPDAPVTANAYLGGFGIAQALAQGADVVVCPRVTDASLVVGPGAWRFGWGPHDWDALAGAVVAGHVIECGAQCTGGNYAFFNELAGLGAAETPLEPGFPIAELHADGSAVITKHPGTGGEVSLGTVTAQLLYEIGAPRYLNPDVTARFDYVQLEQQGPDRVRVFGARGEPPPPELKLCVNYMGGYRNRVRFLLGGLDVEAKARWAEQALFAKLGGAKSFAEVNVRLVRSDRPDPRSYDEALAELVISVKDRDSARVGRAFSSAAVELTLSSYPGFAVVEPPGDARSYAVYWPTRVPREAVREEVVIGAERWPIAPLRAPAAFAALPEPASVEPRGESQQSAEKSERVPLGRLVGARSGDKGGNANLGLWVRSAEAYAWLSEFMTIQRFRELLPEARELVVERYSFPRLFSLNFVVVGLLGEGVASSLRSDPQAKSLGEYLRAKLVPIPAALLR